MYGDAIHECQARSARHRRCDPGWLGLPVSIHLTRTANGTALLIDSTRSAF